MRRLWRCEGTVMTVVMALEEVLSGENYMCVWSTKWQNGCRERAFL